MTIKLLPEKNQNLKAVLALALPFVTRLNVSNEQPAKKCFGFCHIRLSDDLLVFAPPSNPWHTQKQNFSYKIMFVLREQSKVIPLTVPFPFDDVPMRHRGTSKNQFIRQGEYMKRKNILISMMTQGSQGNVERKKNRVKVIPRVLRDRINGKSYSPTPKKSGIKLSLIKRKRTRIFIVNCERISS